QNLEDDELPNLTGLDGSEQVMYSAADSSEFSALDLDNLANSLLYGSLSSAPTAFSHLSATPVYHASAYDYPDAIDPRLCATARVQPIAAPPGQDPAAPPAPDIAVPLVVPPTKQVRKSRVPHCRSITYPTAADPMDMDQFTRHPETGKIALSDAQFAALTDYHRYDVPPEEVQIAVLTAKTRQNKRWTHWEMFRLARRVSDIPMGWGDAFVKKTHQFWEIICEDTFLNSRSAGALFSQYLELKKLYGYCIEYNKLTGGGGDGDTARYDRSLDRSTLVVHLDTQLQHAWEESLAIDKDFTAEAYMHWTHDEKNGLFALLGQQYVRLFEF
ncbi:hypothetical protein FRC10_007784, partial [Ceratobasidium sp. 414]